MKAETVLVLIIAVAQTSRPVQIAELALPSTDVDERQAVDSACVPPTCAFILPDCDTGTIAPPTTVTLIAPVPAVFVTPTPLVVPTSNESPNEWLPHCTDTVPAIQPVDMAAPLPFTTIADDDTHAVDKPAVPPIRARSLVGEGLPIVDPTTVTLADPVDTTLLRSAPLGVAASQVSKASVVPTDDSAVTPTRHPNDVPALVFVCTAVSDDHVLTLPALPAIRTIALVDI